MNQKKNLITPISKYSILLAVVIIIYSLTKYQLGAYTERKAYHYIFLFLVTILSLIGGILSFKKNNDSIISVVQAIKIGTGIVVFGGLLISLFEILLHYIDPSLIDHIHEKNFKDIPEKSYNLSEKSIQNRIDITKYWTSPKMILIYALIEDLIVGSFLSLIVGLIIRKKNRSI